MKKGVSQKTIDKTVKFMNEVRDLGKTGKIIQSSDIRQLIKKHKVSAGAIHSMRLLGYLDNVTHGQYKTKKIYPFEPIHARTLIEKMNASARTYYNNKVGKCPLADQEAVKMPATSSKVKARQTVSLFWGLIKWTK